MQEWERKRARMKKLWPLALAALLMFTSGCGGEREQEVDLERSCLAGVSALETAGEWEEDYLTDLDGELLEGYYPGLGEVDMKQLVAKVPAMSSDVNELVFLQGETKKDADAAADILQARIDGQVEGGAWYAESQAAWEQAVVLRQGNTYVALIASADQQEQWELWFQGWFAQD